MYNTSCKFLTFFQLTQIFMWTITFSTISAIFYISFIYEVIGRNFLLNAVFIGFIRNIWGLSIAWIIFACHSGSGGFVNKLLSSKYWLPIGKIGLSLYLIHPVILYNFAASKENQLNLETSNLVSCQRC